MVLTKEQKRELAVLLDSEYTKKIVCEDLETILFLDTYDYHNMGAYVVDVDKRDGTDNSDEDFLDIYLDEVYERSNIVSRLQKTHDVEVFCKDIEYIETSMMCIDLEYYREDAERKLSTLKTDLAKEIIIQNNSRE